MTYLFSSFGNVLTAFVDYFGAKNCLLGTKKIYFCIVVSTIDIMCLSVFDMNAKNYAEIIISCRGSV